MSRRNMTRARVIKLCDPPQRCEVDVMGQHYVVTVWTAEQWARDPDRPASAIAMDGGGVIHFAPILPWRRP